eukprot:gb/GECH01003532.1/.p1 GENE.gb/GECH01003532.1/~~gb/GECH01003532.1/.p1  ORF type:complete len:162 (+),score=18.22 gb/GECH01003532.1/:1-486(+)
MDDMSSMGNGMGNMHMQMVFYWGTDVTLLWSWWKTTNAGTYVASIFAVFVIGIINQLLSYFVKRPLPHKHHHHHNTKPMLEEDRNWKTHFKQFKTFVDSNRKFNVIAKPVIFMIQFTLSYFLMLIAMSFNGGIFIAVILGNVVGYTLFSLKRNVPPEDCCE